jgi:protein-tyrosine phosphatase
VQVLVVCTANIARSPLAAAMLSRALGSDVEVSSAGTRARAGFPAAPESVRLGEERGLDLRDHRSCLVTPELVAEADLVLTMSERQRDAVGPMAPRTAGRVFSLREFDRLTGAVEGDTDPAAPVSERLRWWRDRAHLARPMAPRAKDREDIADPIGKPWEHWVALGAQLDELVPAIAGRVRLD